MNNKPNFENNYKSKNLAKKQVRLRLVYIDFWSSIKISFFISLAYGIITFVVINVAFFVIDSSGVINQFDDLIGTITDASRFGLNKIINFNNALIFSIYWSLIVTIAFTLLGAVISSIYNLIAKITGGLLLGFTSN